MALEIDLEGRVALITGVTDGIGQGVARMLSKAGCHVSGCGRSAVDSEGAKQFKTIVEAESRQSLYTSCDVTSRENLSRFVAATVEKWQKIDIVISNAGAGVFKGVEGCTEVDWQFNLDLNFSAHWRLAQLCKPYLDVSGEGTIVIIGSNHAYSTIPGCFPYSATKAGLVGLVQSLAIEWGPKIRTVGLAPGFIDTRQNQNWFGSFPDPVAERKRTEAMHPVKRLGTVGEMGGFCAFLASPFAGFASGTTYLVDGGRSALMQDD